MLPTELWYLPTGYANMRSFHNRSRAPHSDYWALVPGIDLHNELALLVEAGFTPLEALQAATLNPAKLLGKTETFGTIQVGRVADFVLLDANPIEDISHTRKINAVVLGGKFYPLASIRAQTLQDAARR